MSNSPSVQHFAPFASLSTSTVGLRPSWLPPQTQPAQQQSQPPTESHSRQPQSTQVPSHHQQRTLSHATNGLDALAEGSQYALNQLQLSRMTESPSLSSNGDSMRKDSLYSGEQQPSITGPQTTTRRDSGTGSRPAKRPASSAPVRRRISRACDQCNQLRTKCDGQAPCAHCVGM